MPKLALEGLKTLALPATLAVSLLSPVNAISYPVNQIEGTFNIEKSVNAEKVISTEKVLQTEKLLKAEKVLREKLVTEKVVKEPSTINLTLNFSPVINTENKEEIRQVLQSYLPDFVRQVEEAVKKIEEQKARRTY